MEICDFLKSWKRMCKSMTEMDGCEDCPIVRNTHGARCGDMPCEMQDVESIAREVEKWAAEHPDLVYPNWNQWLVSIGVIPKEIDNSQYRAIIDLGLIKPIPADIAEKLGVKPKDE